MYPQNKNINASYFKALLTVVIIALTIFYAAIILGVFFQESSETYSKSEKLITTKEKKIPKFSFIKSKLMGSNDRDIKKLLGPPDRYLPGVFKERYIYYSAAVDDLDDSLKNIEVIRFYDEGVKYIISHIPGDNIDLDFFLYIKTPKLNN